MSGITKTSDDSRTSGVQHAKAKAMPQLSLKVFLVGNCFRGGAVEWFLRAGCKEAKSLDEAELVVFLGGEDVDPKLYGEKECVETHCNPARDEREMKIHVEAKARGIPMLGVCRGHQFLQVMAGGKLFQDVKGHAGNDHEITDQTSGRKILSSSIHHQMVIENSGESKMEVLAYSSRAMSGIYSSFGKTMQTDTYREVEAAIWPEDKAIGFQGHPELGGLPEYTIWCTEHIQKFLNALKQGDEPKHFKGRPVKDVKDVNFLSNSVKEQIG